MNISQIGLLFLQATVSVHKASEFGVKYTSVGILLPYNSAKNYHVRYRINKAIGNSENKKGVIF